MGTQGNCLQVLSHLTYLMQAEILLDYVVFFYVPMEMLGRKFYHEVRVLKHLTEDIIGIDLIHKQHLAYDPENREFFLVQTTTTQSFQLCLKYSCRNCQRR